MAEKSNHQIKREWEAEEARKDREREQDMRLACIQLVKNNPIDKNDQIAPWRRAKALEHYILKGSNPEGSQYEGFGEIA